jgi:glycosyltransferase involved in cell wall biosynthesis
MRVLHISASDVRGGAARSAYNLLQGLRELRCDAGMLVKEKLSEDDQVFATELANGQLKQVEAELEFIHRKLIIRHRTNISNTCFSLPVLGSDLINHPEVLRSQLLHLHWVTDFLTPNAIGRLQTTGRPLIWTLHDQRAFTGGCHFSAGCRGFESGCDSCPQLDFNEPPLTRASLNESISRIDASKLVVVSPSRWLAEQARRSVFLRDTRIEVIPYGIDTAVFRPGRSQARQELGLSPQTIYLLTGADTTWEQRKGLNILFEAIRGIKFSNDVQLVIFGSENPLKGIDVPTRWLGRLDNPEELACWYRASDAFLLPSTEDNLPNTMLEALCCGTPVIGFSVGGIPEAVESGNSGLLADVVSPKSLAQLIRHLIDDKQLRQKLHENLHLDLSPKFGLAAQAQRYLKLYEELAQSPARPAVPTNTKGPFGEVYPALLRAARREQREGRWRKLRRWFRFDPVSERS